MRGKDSAFAHLCGAGIFLAFGLILALDSHMAAAYACLVLSLFHSVASIHATR